MARLVKLTAKDIKPLEIETHKGIGKVWYSQLKQNVVLKLRADLSIAQSKIKATGEDDTSSKIEASLAIINYQQAFLNAVVKVEDLVDVDDTVITLEAIHGAVLSQELYKIIVDGYNEVPEITEEATTTKEEEEKKEKSEAPS